MQNKTVIKKLGLKKRKNLKIYATLARVSASTYSGIVSEHSCFFCENLKDKGDEQWQPFLMKKNVEGPKIIINGPNGLKGLRQFVATECPIFQEVKATRQLNAL